MACVTRRRVGTPQIHRTKTRLPYGPAEHRSRVTVHPVEVSQHLPRYGEVQMRYAVGDDELETLAASWLAMAQATSLDAIEAATLQSILQLVDAEIAYTARLENAVWTISEEVGLTGDVAGVAVSEENVPYAQD